MREELHHLVDQLPEAELRPALEPSASRSMCRASSRAATSRANVVFPLPAQPTTTTRSGIGQVMTGRTIMPMTIRREGQALTPH